MSQAGCGEEAGVVRIVDSGKGRPLGWILQLLGVFVSMDHGRVVEKRRRYVCCLGSILCVVWWFSPAITDNAAIAEEPEPRNTPWQPLEFNMPDRLTPEQIEEFNKLQERYFNENVDLFEPPLPEGVPERLKATIKASQLRPGERVLDVGTGTGILIPYILKHRPSEIHACDLSANMLRRVKSKFPQVKTHLSDVRDLLLADDSLDVVFINACFSNIMDKSGSLNNLYRLLRPKGRLVISHPLGRDFIIELKKHTPFHLDLLPDEASARALFGQHGFEIVSFRDEPLYYLLVGMTTKQGEPSVASRGTQTHFA